MGKMMNVLGSALLALAITCTGVREVNAQEAASSAYGLSGTLTVNQDLTVYAPIPLVEQYPATDKAYAFEDNAHFDLVPEGYTVLSSKTSWTGSSPQPIEVMSVATVNVLDVRVRNPDIPDGGASTDIFRLYVDNLQTLVYAGGTCPNSVLKHSVVTHGNYKIYVLEQEIDLPNDPAPNTVIEVVREGAIGHIYLHEIWFEDDHTLRVNGMRIELTIFGKGSPFVDVNLALARSDVYLDCLGVPVELQQFYIE